MAGRFFSMPVGACRCGTARAGLRLYPFIHFPIQITRQAFARMNKAGRKVTTPRPIGKHNRRTCPPNAREGGSWLSPVLGPKHSGARRGARMFAQGQERPATVLRLRTTKTTTTTPPPMSASAQQPREYSRCCSGQSSHRAPHTPAARACPEWPASAAQRRLHCGCRAQ